MTAVYDPTADEQNDLQTALATLMTSGITPDPKGYALPTLASAVYEQGGAYAIDFVHGSFHAEIRPQDPSSRIRPSTAVGWTPVVALALALARSLS
jgi:hypothetical protein